MATTYNKEIKKVYEGYDKYVKSLGSYHKQLQRTCDVKHVHDLDYEEACALIGKLGTKTQNFYKILFKFVKNVKDLSECNTLHTWPCRNYEYIKQFLSKNKIFNKSDYSGTLFFYRFTGSQGLFEKLHEVSDYDFKPNLKLEKNMITGLLISAQI